VERRAIGAHGHAAGGARGGRQAPSAGGARRLVMTAVAAMLVATVVVAAVVVRRRPPMPPVAVAPRFLGSDVHAPDGVRIKVEVLNATRTHGLGRRATMYLRDHGFDVVSLGTSTDLRDTTLVIDRSGHPDFAHLIAQGLGGARVESRPDSSRYVDVSVLVGSEWRPPALPFYP
jgi:LytR cell envelope-related transcriptional attenuator